MTIDERIDRLTERHEALTQSVEMLAKDVRDLAVLVKDIASRSPKPRTFCRERCSTTSSPTPGSPNST